MIYVVGTGPGSVDGMTQEARNVIASCDAVAGYRRYVELIEELTAGKITYTDGMTQERDRCEMALKLSSEFKKNVALVSSGDSGVYGMAGLMLEVAKGTGEEVRVVPGVTAANSAAAILGAPLMNDYVTISLSDLMTAWETIAKRLVAACMGDFVICIYNPASTQRPEHFKRACDILLLHKSPETPAGYVRNIGREGQEHEIMTLGEIRERKLDMLCTVIIGNSTSYILDGKIITPRGYKC